MVNKVCLSGKVTANPEYSHTSRNIEYYQFSISIMRLSGVEDTIPVIAPKTLIDEIEIKEKSNVCVKGEYRSFKNFANNKLELYLFAKHIEYCEPEIYYNYIKLEGRIVKKGDLRTTQITHKRIVDILLVVDRYETKSSAIPCIIWNLTDEEFENLKIGDNISICGRIQSRDYIKMYDDETTESKTAYEVSIKSYEKI